MCVCVRVRVCVCVLEGDSERDTYALEGLPWSKLLSLENFNNELIEAIISVGFPRLWSKSNVTSAMSV